MGCSLTAAVTIELSTIGSASIIKNLYPLYIHDLSQFTGAIPNAHGVLEGEATKSLEQQADLQSAWWEHPDQLFPLLIRVDGDPAGFAMIATEQFAPPSADYYMHEFFLARPFRGRDIGDSAVKEIFERYVGKWEVHVLAGNESAHRFWTRIFSRLFDDCRTEQGPIWPLEEGHTGTTFRARHAAAQSVGSSNGI